MRGTTHNRFKRVRDGGFALWGAALVATGGALTWGASTALACGCLSPPIPEVSDSSFAVNQQSEQIIFEVEEGYITAHVLIRYAGEPEKFAWIVPTPSVPELALSEPLAFGMVAQATAPQVWVNTTSLCPDPEYQCTYHHYPTCPQPDGADTGWATADAGASQDSASPGNGGAGLGGVVVHSREQIGSYETVVFGAGEASTAVLWLQQEGFIVNDTMAPYMQPYLDAGMVFVASRLIAGAGIDEIKPLRMRFEADNPMIPLQLTAVAAEPHLTVTAYIFAPWEVQPVEHPLLGLESRWLSVDRAGRSNYPMVVARAADDAGGDGFVMEYSGAPRIPRPNSDSFCCSDGWDQCALGYDGVCQCPGTDFDRDDCADQTELLGAIDMVTRLQQSYPRVTRLTTRLSPEEMTFDPMFTRAAQPSGLNGPIQLVGNRNTMLYCEADIIDRSLYNSIEQTQGCATTYCGQGECAVTSQGNAGCACDQGFVARTFTDLDGQPSVTCVPRTGTVNLAAGGLDLPDACQGISCGTGGTCIDIGGFPACQCAPGYAAALSGTAPSLAATPRCEPIAHTTGSPGARDYTGPMEDVRACAPRPPECGQWGWLVPNPYKERQGVLCPSSIPDPSDLEIPPAPTCEDMGLPSNPGGTSGPGNPQNPNDPSIYPDAGNGNGFPDAGSGSGSTSGPNGESPAAGNGGEDSGGCSTAPGVPSGLLPALLLVFGMLIARR